MDRPGGGPFRREVVGVRGGAPKVASCGRADESPPLSWTLPDFCPFCLASMICRCRSRTFRLRCSCSRMPGSLVWKPGDRQAKPTSWIARPADSREVSGAEGRAVGGAPVVAVLEDRSSLLGRGREDCMAGERGSFLMLTVGGAPVRCLRGSHWSVSACIIRFPTHELTRGGSVCRWTCSVRRR